MKLRTLIAFLETLPQDSTVHICGTDRFFMYFGKENKETFITFDIDELDVEDFKSNGVKGLKFFDSITVSTQYEAELKRKANSNEALEVFKSAKALEDLNIWKKK
jgi:hypothetical protein